MNDIIHLYYPYSTYLGLPFLTLIEALSSSSEEQIQIIHFSIDSETFIEILREVIPL